MLHMNGYDAWITVDDVELPEYEVKEGVIGHNGECITCWVPSEAGKNFKVHWRDTRLPRIAATAVLHIDGEKLHYSILRGSEGSFADPDRNTFVWSTVPVAAGKECSLQFSVIESSEDDSLEDTITSAKHLGEISFFIRPAIVTSEYRQKFKVHSTLKIEQVHERSKKVGVHRTRLGDKHQGAKQGIHCTVKEKDVAARFVFRYRPISFLQAQGIAPFVSQNVKRRMETEGLELQNDIDSEDVMLGSTSNNEEDLRRINWLQAELRKLKKKRAKRCSKRIKVEPFGHHEVFKFGEVIDLT